MPYTPQRKRSDRKSRNVVNVHQNKFPKGYISTIDNSRRPIDSLSDLTNIEVVQDNVLQPRPPLVRYGTQPSLDVLGRGNIRYGGSRSLLWMLKALAVKASGIITSTANGNPTAGQTMVIGATTYTFRSTFSAGPTVANEIQIGATGEATLNNLRAALVLSGTPGTEYSVGTTANASASAPVVAVLATDATLTIQALTAGTAGNSIVLTESATNITVSGSGTLSGGEDDHGEIYKQTDGGSFTLCGTGGVYDDAAWAGFVQSKGKAYAFNSVDNLSYVDLSDDSIHVYTALTTPGAPTVTKTGMTGTAFTHYYRISANNEVGESIASVAGSVTSGKTRDSWVNLTDYNTITWSAVTDAVSYTIYYGSSATDCKELYTVAGNATTTFYDYGTLVVNPYKLAPEGNSTLGAVFVWMYVDTKNSQIFGITADNKLYYSAPGTGDFSPYNGGGWVAIDEDGDTQLNYVDGFRNGKGDPVITVSARGAAGKGKLYHVSFEQLTVGDQIIIYPNVYEANGQSGTYSARGTIKARDALYYFTGRDVKSTGTSQNIMNILTTNTVSQVIEPDLEDIDLANLHKAVGIESQDRLYWSLPVGSTENNQIWYIDLSRRNLWVLRWPVAAKDLWLYEDSMGATHFCALVNNVVLEFTRAGSLPHQDDDVAWTSRIGFKSLVWDEDGITLGSIRNQYFKLLSPRGTIDANAYGLTRKGVQQFVGTDRFSTAATASFTGIGDWDYSGDYQYGDDPGEVTGFSKGVAILKIKPRGLLNQLDWEVTSSLAGSDYILSAVNTRGFAFEELTLKTTA